VYGVFCNHYRFNTINSITVQMAILLSVLVNIFIVCAGNYEKI
jgi:hypothetical protein